jgi:thiamine-phosphate pyrophosphorylase
MLGGDPMLASAWGADGSHGLARGKAGAPHLLSSASVQNTVELEAARRAGADFVFVSPVFPTRSHPGSPTLGRLGLGRLARSSAVPVIALGGMDAARARSLAGFNLHGWAAIDAWNPA